MAVVSKDNENLLALPKNLYDDSIAAIESSLSMWASKRRFGVTNTGRMVLVPHDAVEGDTIVLVEGCRVPYVFRRVEHDDSEAYTVIGEVFVEDLMSGEFYESVCHRFGSFVSHDTQILKEFQVR
jgi:hypothetical protein